MPQKTLTQQQKRSKTMAIVLVVVLLLTVAVLLVGLRARNEVPKEQIGVEERLARQEALRAVQEITMPREFFTEDVLGAFAPYSPSEAPDTWGRENPFEEFTSVPLLPPPLPQ